MATAATCAGEVMATNFLLVNKNTNYQQLAGAIAARMRQEAHTVLECYGATAVTTAILVSADAAARDQLVHRITLLSCVHENEAANTCMLREMAVFLEMTPVVMC